MFVTSLAEVWIEIHIYPHLRLYYLVTSLAEVWIEIHGKEFERRSVESLPLRKCGLKCPRHVRNGEFGRVTSLAEVWIEIDAKIKQYIADESLPLRKCGLKLSQTQMLV